MKARFISIRSWVRRRVRNLRRLLYLFFVDANASHHRAKVIVAQFPRHTERVQDQALRCLTTRHAFFNCVNCSCGYARLTSELILRPSKRLSCRAYSVHAEPLRGVPANDGLPPVVPADELMLASIGAMSQGQTVDRHLAFCSVNYRISF